MFWKTVSDLKHTFCERAAVTRLVLTCSFSYLAVQDVEVPEIPVSTAVEATGMSQIIDISDEEELDVPTNDSKHSKSPDQLMKTPKSFPREAIYIYIYCANIIYRVSYVDITG